MARSSLQSVAVSSVDKGSRPLFRMSAAAFCTTLRPETFSGLANSPTRLMVSASFLNQRQEFLVARRPQQGRFGDATPLQEQLCSDKLFEFVQHTFVHGVIGNDAGAFVGFRLSRFELRLD